jgi:hypothetical protein
MIIFKKKSIISIGCSCINQFQVDFYFKNKFMRKTIASSIFDWNIVTPRSTIEFFDYANSGEVKSVMCNKENYTIENRKLINVAFEGFCFWHENSIEIMSDEYDKFSEFSNKISHMIDNIFSVSDKNNIVVLWSNLQPNLKSAISALPVSWDSFILTEELYEKIKHVVYFTYGEKTDIVFTTRVEDVDKAIKDNNDVRLFDLDRSQDFTGPNKLYNGIFKDILSD